MLSFTFCNNGRMDRIDGMTAFVAVVDHAGFAPAARALARSPASVTRSIAALEDRLAIRLLHRTTRSVTLTDAGARYLERARRILTEITEAEGAARAERTAPFGKFVVTAPTVFGRREVAPLMSAFLTRYPEVSADLVLTDRTLRLVEDGIDAAVRIGVLEDSGMVARRVGSTRRVVVAAPTYLARAAKVRAPRDLAAHAIVQFTGLSPLASWSFYRNGELDDTVAVRPVLSSNSADAALEHTVAGGGIAMFLAYQVSDLVRAGKLEILLARHEPPALPIHVLHATSRLLSANVRAFLELVGKRGAWDFTDL